MSCCERVAAAAGGLCFFQILVICLLVLLLFLHNLYLIYLFILIIYVRVSTYMERYRNKALPQLYRQDLAARGVRMPKKRERMISNPRVLCVGGGEDIKRK